MSQISWPLRRCSAVRASPLSRFLLLAGVVALSGCAAVAIQDNDASVTRFARERLGAEVRWASTPALQAQARAAADALLAGPLAADDAVRLALAHSAALQALLAEHAAASAEATRSARLPNPLLTFERLVRGDGDARELEIDRKLTVSLLDLLTLPARADQAGARQQQLRLQSAADVAEAAIEARQAWVRAVAAGQALAYAERVNEAAQAGATLARRMEAAGNFSKLDRAREQAFEADAAAELARARHAAVSSREALVRSLGLDAAQAARLQLPARLPDLPNAPRDARSVEQAALDGRLDVQLAKAELARVAKAQGLTRVTSVVNGLDLSAVRNGATGQPAQKGYEVELPLPVFDAGDASRAQAQARYLAALNRAAQRGVEASSEVRERYDAYRTAYALAAHYRDEVVPLRKVISDEMLLRYNGMLASVFELLADAREQAASVSQAIAAQRDFFLADAALEAALIGAPSHAARAAGAAD